ncbi:MAG: hypothetical protein JXB23_00325 [Candidatus Aminicenantes bacterium]|nr:hypothetical protein [Candidatus Aminicenantes bacterium]
MASGDENLVELCCSFRFFLDDLPNVIRNTLNIMHKRPGGIIGDEAPGRQCRFNGLLDRIDLLSLAGAQATPLILIRFHDSPGLSLLSHHQ